MVVSVGLLLGQLPYHNPMQKAQQQKESCLVVSLVGERQSA